VIQVHELSRSCSSEKWGGQPFQIHSFISCSFIHSFILVSHHSFIHSHWCHTIHSFIHSFILVSHHSFIHSFILVSHHSFIHSFIHSILVSHQSFIHIWHLARTTTTKATKEMGMLDTFRKQLFKYIKAKY
jgi:hypothetical protein